MLKLSTSVALADTALAIITEIHTNRPNDAKFPRLQLIVSEVLLGIRYFRAVERQPWLINFQRCLDI